VANFAKGGATIMKKTNSCYMRSIEYENLLQSQPDFVAIFLGTNDAYDDNWNEANFRKDYAELIRSFKNLTSKPKVYMVIPSPTCELQYNATRLMNYVFEDYSSKIF
jgi:lysophospholipase L1-like esterase